MEHCNKTDLSPQSIAREAQNASGGQTQMQGRVFDFRTVKLSLP